MIISAEGNTMAKGQDWYAVRALAESVMCPYCFAPAGVTCTSPDLLGNRVEVNHLAAHPLRVTAANAAAADSNADGSSG